MSPRDVQDWRHRYFEDFHLGESFRHAVGRTITETDNTWFTLVTVNTNQLHFNREYAQATEFTAPLVNSCLTLSIVTGLTVADISQHAVANLGWDDVRLTHPVRVGDTLWAESMLLEKRPSESRPEAGLVKIGTRGINQDGRVCITFTRTILVRRRDSGDDPAQAAFPNPETPIEELFDR